MPKVATVRGEVDTETLGQTLMHEHIINITPDIEKEYPDLSWIGGISEARKVASYAEAHHLPVAPHDCTGPITYTASVHLSMNAPNTLVQESVRSFYTGWYKEIVTDLPQMKDGYIYPMSGAGLGTRLLPDLTKRPDAKIRRSAT